MQLRARLWANGLHSNLPFAAYLNLALHNGRDWLRLCEKGSVFGANLYRDVGVAITEHQSAQNRLPDCPSCAMTHTAVADFIMQVLAQLPKPQLTWPRR
jgi:hypothetical protein